MAIKKRRVPKRKGPPKKKLSAHELVCRALYNRLQDDTDEAVLYVMNKLTPVEWPVHTALSWLMSQCDTEVNTLQINGTFGRGATYRVSMKYTDRTKEPRYGYLYPSVFVVKSSPMLIVSVMLAYIELAKNLGRWPHEKT